MQDEIDLRIVFRYAWRRIWVVVVSVIVFLALGKTYIYFKQPRYLATSKFIVKTSEDNAAGQLRNLAALAGINVGGGSSINPDAVFGELLKDDEFLEKILHQKWSTGRDSFDIPSMWHLSVDTLKPEWRYRLSKQQVEKLREGGFLRLEKTKSTGITMFKTLFPDPLLATQVNSYVLKLFNEFMVRDQVTQASEKRKFIADRIGEIERDLRSSEERLVDFQMKNKNVTIASVMMEQLRLKRSMDINQELYLQLKKQLEIVKIEEKNEQPVIQLISKPVVPVSPFKPNQKLVMAVALAAGIFGGISILLAQYLYTAIRGNRGVKTA